MMRLTQRFLPLLLAILSACVTINIYFPEAAAEKAADRIIRDVWGVPPAAPEAPASDLPAHEPTSERPKISYDLVVHRDGDKASLREAARRSNLDHISYCLRDCFAALAMTRHQVRSDRGLGTVLARIFQLVLVTPAYAAEPDLTISTPAIEKLTNSMRARHTQLEPYYQSGAIGLTRNALVEVRNAQAIPLNQRNVVKQLVADENSDRTALYTEIAKANGHPEWADSIRATFAQRWVANASSGWWYQDSNGTWKQK